MFIKFEFEKVKIYKYKSLTNIRFEHFHDVHNSVNNYIYKILFLLFKCYLCYKS